MIKTPLSTVIGGAFWTPSATILGGTSKIFNQIIKSLFANNEQGFAYDPNDLSTMFQDAAGTVPVTSVGQAVGLILDKSKGMVLSDELSSGIVDFTDWVKTAAVISASENSFTTDDFGGCYNTLGEALSLGKTYQIRIIGYCTVSFFIRSPSSEVGSVFIPAGAFDVTLKTSVTFSDGLIYFLLQAAGTISVNSISIKETAGNHAYQTTSASRPILLDAPQRVDFDAVDDKLITNLPAQLTDCTVVRSVPNVGTQILTGQTIPAIYEDNTDHCGLIVINRALTPSETSAITAEFNKRAGV